ncbi:MAG: TIGR00341 family protein [Desulfobulbaceae bacterium]|nr:TIGR00341 family protein [Desulfobulbaceae bacterium]
MTAEDSSEQHKEAARAGIQAGAELSPAYLLMNVLAATIASYGLFANSPAVIIGAMLIAMLLGPITGISLALVDSDMKFLLRGFMTLIAGAAVVFATAFIIGSIHTDVPLSREIMARTNPNLADLVIALAGGAAGAYATISPRLSVAFVGVAIATALVPPLCAANILFARGEFALGAGALLLTFTNIVAIQFSSSVVFWLSGFRKISRTKGLSFLAFMRSNLVSIAILCVLAVVLTDKVHEILARKIYETSTESILRSKINNSLGSYFMLVRFNEKDKEKCIVTAGMVGTNPPSAGQVAAIEKSLPPHPERKAVELRIRYAQTSIINREGQLLKDAEFELQE